MLPQLTHTHAQWLLLVGRILIGLIFVVAGYSKVSDGVGTLADTIEKMTWLPFPVLFAAFTIAIELGGGLLLMLGFWARRAALAIAIATIIITYFFHPGWSNPDQLMPLLKNLAIIGGLLGFIAVGPGDMSLDKKIRGNRTPSHETTS